MNADQLKRNAARTAMDWLEPGAVVGVGTGSTVAHFIDALIERRDEFPVAVSSSQRSTAQLQAGGIRVVDLNDTGPIRVYVDGADEVDPACCLIKGGGGALTREKILAEASERFVCIVDAAKCVPVLGRFPLPLEVVPMARSLVLRRANALGGTARVRDGFTTDEGNPVIDVSGLRIDDPVALERELSLWPGVVTVGLFARRRADVVLVADPAGLNVIEAPAR